MIDLLSIGLMALIVLVAVSILQWVRYEFERMDASDD